MATKKVNFALWEEEEKREERMIRFISTTLHYIYRRWGGGIVQITYRGFGQFGYTNIYK